MRTLLCAVALLALQPLGVGGVLVVEADRDTTIYSDGELSNGIGANMSTARTTVGFFRRALVRFDLSSIPPGSVIDSVAVTLSVTNLSMAQAGVSGALHRLTNDWGEGTSDAGILTGSGALATPGDATWTANLFGTSSWTTPGGDFVAAPSVTIVPSLGLVTYPSTPALVADVQLLVDDASQNFGWIILADETVNGTGVLYETHEGTNPPTIQVDYSPNAFTDLGSGLAGTGGTPALAGLGAMNGDDPVTLSLTDALPGASAVFVLGVTNISAPFKGGVLVPSVDVLIPGLPVDGTGAIVFGFTWRTGVPSGVSLYYQYWIPDPGGVFGFSASNALQSTTP